MPLPALLRGSIHRTALAALLLIGPAVAAEVVTVSPARIDGAPGGATTLTASAPGAADLTWQWRLNGRNLDGQTAPSLFVPHRSQNSGTYDVIARGPAGSWRSPAVPVAVTTAWDPQLVLHLQPDAAGAPVDVVGGTTPRLVGRGAPPLRSDGPAGLAAWTFSDAGRQVVVPGGPVLQALGDPRQGSGVTLAFWLRQPAERPTTGRVGGRVTSSAHVMAFDPLLYLVEDADGGLYGQLGAHIYESHLTFRTPPLADGAWHHVAVTLDQRYGLGAVYVDGQRQLPNPARKHVFQRVSTRFMTDLPWGSRNDFRLGSDAKGGNVWRGSLAEVRWYAKALKPAEVAVLATRPGQPAPPAPTVRFLPPPTAVLPPSGGPVTVTLRAHGTTPDGALTYRWRSQAERAVPKETLTITPGDPGTAQVTLTLAGTYRLFCQVTDARGQTDEDQVLLTAAINQAPAIGAAQAGMPTAHPAGGYRSDLTATLTDDGLPHPPAFLTSTWSQVAGPGPARIAAPGNPTTTVILPQAGTYRFRLEVTDGALTAAAEVVLDTAAGTPSPLAAGTSATTVDLTQTTTAELRGVQRGPSEPTGWRQIDGPAPAQIRDPARLTSVVTLPRPGQYRFALTGTTSRAEATTWINAWMPGALAVNAGSSRVVWLPDAVLDLHGSTTAGPAARCTWSRAEGPGPVTFLPAEALASRATFTVAGTYALRLTVEDGARSGSDLLVVEVHPPERDFGYTVEERRAFTGDPRIPRDLTGLDWSRLAPVPPPGVHPRLLFGPEDLPELRQRLTTGTVIGPLIMADIRERVAALRSKPDFAKLYQALAAGDAAPCEAPGAPLNAFTILLKLEAFRILIDQDAAAAPALAAVITTLAERASRRIPDLRRRIQAEIDAQVVPTMEWSRFREVVHDDRLAWAYDFLHDAMTPAQRASVRQMLAEVTRDTLPLGAPGLPGLYASCSNWVPLTTQGWLHAVLVIEGEEGSRPADVLTYAALCSRSLFGQALPDGSTVEGGGKGWIGIPSFYALARRGHMAVTSTSLRHYLTRYLLHIQEPHGHAFTFEEVNGGSEGRVNFIDDVLVMKHLYPQDPVIDFVYRSSFSLKGEDPAHRSMPYIGGPVLAAICARDVTSTRPWAEALAQDIAPTTPLTGLFDHRGLVVARSAWTTDAVRLFFQPRTVRGGHMQADRNAIVVNGLGRTWMPMWVYQSGSGPVAGDSSMSANIVRVDDQPSSNAISSLLDVTDTPRFTSATGDASNAYRTRTGGPDTKDAPRLRFTATYNQRRLSKTAEGWADLADSDLPAWRTSQKGDWRLPLVWPEARAFRTAALVRGARPYVLVADDLRIDGKPHRYAWRTMLAKDLRGRGHTSGNDAIYTDPDGTRALLIRVLACASTPTLAIDNRYQHFDMPWFDLKVEAIEPAFRILIMPFMVGTPLPTTTFDGRLLTVDHGGGKVDRLTFQPEAAGWTRIVPDTITVP